MPSREGNTIGGDALEKATQALEVGDTSLAQSLFEASTRASFALGEISEQEVRWQEAFTHYNEVARLHPTYAHLIIAQKMAFHIANYPKAEALAKAALKTSEVEFSQTAPEHGTTLNNLAVLLEATRRFIGRRWRCLTNPSGQSTQTPKK